MCRYPVTSGLGPGGAPAAKRGRGPVGDGDTIRVRMNGTLISARLACIDAPAAQRPDGQQSRQSGCDAKEYLDADNRASRRRYEVWQVEGGITRPWDFRRQRRGVAPGGGAMP